MRATALGIFLSVVVSATVAQQPAPAGGDATKGEPIATGLCAACHGPDGNSPLPANPSLAGQHANYVYKQLTDYKSGRRVNPIMNGIAANLSEPDMRNLAAYFANQKPKGNTAKNSDQVNIGKTLYRAGNAEAGIPACSGCHSPNGAGIPIQYPRLAGQHGEYTAAQLQLFRSGQRANDPAGMMRMIAQRMKDPEIAAVADYLSGLR